MKLSRRDWLRLGAVAGAWAGLLPSVSNAAPTSNSKPSRQKWSMGVNPGQSLPPEAIDGPWKNLRAVKAKKVFDIHCHAYGPPAEDPKIPVGTQNAGGWQDNTHDLIAAMDQHGVAQAAMSPAHELYEFIVTTDVKPHLDRFVKTMGMPTEASKGKELTPQLMAEIYRTRLKLDGCMLLGETAGDPFLSLLRQGKFTAKDLKPMAEVVMEYDIPVQMHTGWSAAWRGSSYAQGYPAAWRWAECMGALLAEYPGIKFIMAHTGGELASPDGWEAARLAFSFDNAYVDTSKSPPEIVSEVVRGIGAERVMFGSDWNRPQLVTKGPFHMRAVYQYWWNLNTIANADLTEEQRDWILYKSARKLLKLPPA